MQIKKKNDWLPGRHPNNAKEWQGMNLENHTTFFL
jgi:hypothetical protein